MMNCFANDPEIVVHVSKNTPWKGTHPTDI